MKSYDIFDNERHISLGTLLYFDKEKTFIAELDDGLDEWDAPLMLSGFVKKGIYTIPRDISKLWVTERIIPSDRQNIAAILSNHKLKEYDEIKFLEISEGRCSQDNISVKKTDEISQYVKDRMSKNLTGMFSSDDKSIICFFADDTVKRIDMRRLKDNVDVDKIIGNESLFKSGKIGAAGYYVTFNDSIDIPAAVLYKSGILLPIKKRDFIAFVENNILDTIEAGKVLSCSRQNISYMVKQNRLKPVKENVMGNLFLKEDVIKNTWG